jgi:hypothetical protein
MLQKTLSYILQVWLFVPSTDDAITLELMSYVFGRKLRKHAMDRIKDAWAGLLKPPWEIRDLPSKMKELLLKAKKLPSKMKELLLKAKKLPLKVKTLFAKHAEDEEDTSLTEDSVEFSNTGNLLENHAQTEHELQTLPNEATARREREIGPDEDRIQEL